MKLVIFDKMESFADEQPKYLCMVLFILANFYLIRKRKVNTCY